LGEKYCRDISIQKKQALQSDGKKAIIRTWTHEFRREFSFYHQCVAAWVGRKHHREKVKLAIYAEIKERRCTLPTPVFVHVAGGTRQSDLTGGGGKKKVHKW